MLYHESSIVSTTKENLMQTTKINNSQEIMVISLQFLTSLPDQAVIEEPGPRVFYTQPQVPGFQGQPLKLRENTALPHTGWMEVHSLSQIR